MRTDITHTSCSKAHFPESDKQTGLKARGITKLIFSLVDDRCLDPNMTVSTSLRSSVRAELQD